MLIRAKLICFDTNCCSRERHCGTCQNDNTCKKKTILEQISNTKTKKKMRTRWFKWFSPNLAYIHEKQTWESFINNLGTKGLTFPLIPARVLTFPLNLTTRLQGYTFPLCTVTSLFLDFLWSSRFPNSTYWVTTSIIGLYNANLFRL